MDASTSLATLVTITAIVVTVLGLFIWHHTRSYACKCTTRLDGCTALVTGGTAGMGRAAAAELARRGARVLVAGPCEQEGLRARADIAQQSGSDAVEFHRLQLGSLRDVRRFAAELRAREPSLRLLVNNAGVGVPADRRTPDHLSYVMQVNYYSHFLLTLLLLPLLRAAAPSRVVNVSSLTHRLGDVNEHLNDIGHWKRLQTYANSKLCLILFSRELAKYSKDSGVTINNADPGLVNTQIYESVSWWSQGWLVRLAARGWFRSPRQGAQTALHLCLGDVTTSGGYYRDGAPVQAAPIVYKDEVATWLWQDTVKRVGLTDDELNAAVGKK